MRADALGQLIGSTPLVRLSDASDASGALVLGKLEARNPSGSIKDRAVAAMLQAAERDGRLARGAAVIVASAGNTALSAAVLGPSLGHPVVLAAPASAPHEWRRLAAGFGVELLLTPAAEGMGGAVRRAQVEARARPGSCLLTPFSDSAAPEAGEAIGEELVRDLDGRVDRVLVGVGTGATAAGLARAFAARGTRTAVVGVEPLESPNLSGQTGGVHHIAGIGAGFVPPHWHASGLTAHEAVASADALAECRRLAAEEGLLVGPSSGACVLAARRTAQTGEVVVAILADGGERYLAQLGFLGEEPPT